MKFTDFRDLGIRTEEDVLITKFLADIHIASYDNAKRVKEEFTRHGFEVATVPGEFLKILTMNEREIGELEQVLDEIVALGLKDVFQNNLRPACFKRDFLERVKFCMNNNIMYVNEDREFRPELYNKILFAEYSTKKPLKEIKTAQEIAEEENRLELLDPEDRQVYNQILENLNFLVLRNATNEYLPQVVDNISKKVVGALARKEYRFLPLSDIVASVMFEGLDVTPQMESVRELVISAFPEEIEKRGRA